MIDAVLVFLGASLILYCILGGADFGAGILEIFSPKDLKSSVEKAVYQGMAPVWEANHMWLILAVVILFNGFPKLYSQLSIYLHIPLTLMLVGIILRGCAFTFRHYDAKKDHSNHMYSRVFQFSSLITTLMIGVIAGALIAGQFNQVDSGLSYWSVYWSPWLNLFTLVVGGFLVLLLTYIASVFLVGESDEPHVQKYFASCAKKACLGAVFMGSLVFVTSFYQGVPLFEQFFSHNISIFCFVTATILLPLTWIHLRKRSKWILRILVSMQMSLILIGWIGLQFPVLISFRTGTAPLGFYQNAAPELSLRILLSALLFGSLLIFPAIGYLFHVFKAERGKPQAN